LSEVTITPQTMKAPLAFLALTYVSAFAQESVPIEQQANIAEETRPQDDYGKLRIARKSVVAAIEAVGDPKKRELYRTLFERNEKTWDSFIDSTARLQQPAKDISAQPDIRYVRILHAEYSEFKIKQYQDFARWIR
jgi:hypothetical protein